MNKLLQRQLREHFGGADKVPESFSKLLNVISASYDDFEKDQKVIERSVELRSKEMIKVNSDLNKEKEELKKAHKELQQTMVAINKIIDSSLDVICAVNEEGYFVQVSAACETIWGYKADELIGKLMIDFVYPDDREKTQKAALKVIAGNNMINFENRYIRKDGSLVPINWSARWDTKDRVRYGVARDATEKKRLDKTFEIERQRFYDLFLKAPFSVGILKGSDHVYEMANPLYLQLICKDDIIGKTVKDVLPEIAAQGFIDLLDGVYKTGITFSANEMLIKLDKERNGELSDVYLNFVYQAYRNNEGIIQGIFFFAIEVTEQVLSRKKIEESEKGYRQIVETAQEGIWMIDENNVTTFVNRKMAEILEYSIEEMLGKKNYCFMGHEDQTKAAEDTVKRKLGMNENHEFNYVTKSGKNVWTNLSTNPVFDDAGIYKGALAMVTDITERKKAEDKIKISELRYRSLVEQATDAICIADATMKFIDINPYGLWMFGYTLEEALQLSLPDILFAEDLVANPIRLNELKLGRTIRNERRLKRKDGTAVDMAVSTKLMEDGSLIMFGHDITERKKAEAVLKENEGQLSMVAQVAKLGYWEFDVAKNLFKFNDHFYSIFKTTAEEVGGYTMSSERYLSLFVHPDDYSIVANVAVTAIKSPDQHSNEQIEHRIKYADGGIGYMTVRFFTVKNELGRTVKTYGAIQDITEKKNSEAALIKRDSQLVLAAEMAGLGYWEFDVVNDVFTFNDQFYAIFKTTAENVGGYTMSSARYTELFVHPDEREIVGRSVAEAINSGDSHFSFKAEHRIIYATGEIGYISVHFYIVKDEQGRTIKNFGVNQDITDRKRDEKLLQKSEESLALYNHKLEQKNKELEQFAYVASHDMQEPLRTTSSFIDLLQKQYRGRLDEKADKYLTFIAQSSDRMKVLIKDLLDYSRIGRKKEFADVDCNIILNEVLADLGTAISETNAVIKIDDLPVISGYRTEIKQLFQNLVINAIKFRKPNTTADINICVQKMGSYWEFAVKDRGIGIDEQHRERIFIIFQRLHTRNEYEGSGIGLAHCRKIVELHGGKIWIESKPGEGSTFHFTVPENNN